MNDAIYDDIALEKLVRGHFGLEVGIKQVVVRDVPTGRTTFATVFLTDKQHLYTLLRGQAAVTLGDVRQTIRRMGMVADAYVPPKAEPDYFERVAREKFLSVFPGRRDPSEADLRFYRLSSPYNPALVRIAEVESSVIKQFDPADSSGWRVAAKFAYKRIKAA